MFVFVFKGEGSLSVRSGVGTWLSQGLEKLACVLQKKVVEFVAGVWTMITNFGNIEVRDCICDTGLNTIVREIA